MTAHALKQMPCRTCGEPIDVGIRTKKAPQHLECSLQNMAEAMRQMKEKSGPYYERWLERQWKAGDERYRITPRRPRKRRVPCETCNGRGYMST